MRLARRPFTLALAAILAIQSSLAAAPVSAELVGRVVSADGVTPRRGVVVALFDETTRAIYRSEPSAPSGGFRIAGAPAGNYRVVAEASEGAFVAGSPVRLAAGANPPLSLALQPAPEPTPPAPPTPTGALKSNSPSSNGSASASPRTHSIVPDLRRARSSIRDEKSSATTLPPRRSASTARSPVPQQASRTLSPGQTTSRAASWRHRLSRPAVITR